MGCCGAPTAARPSSTGWPAQEADQQAAGKAAIAELAAGLVQAGRLHPARAGPHHPAPWPGCWPRSRELTVVTNSVPVTQALMHVQQIDLVMMGGNLRRSIQALVGPVAEQNAAGLRVSQVFLSGEGVTVERGLTTPNLFAAATDQALAAAARQVVVLADSAKIGRETMCQTVPCAGIDVLITDSGADAVELDRLRGAGVDVRVAPLGDRR